MKITISEIENIISKETVLYFDLDGTLVNTDYANLLAYNKAINNVIGKDTIFNYESNKRFTREKLKIEFPNLTNEQYENIIKKKELFYKEFLTETKLNENVFYFLNKYFRSNRTFLVTNCRKNRALSILKYHKIEDNFDKIFYRKLNSGIRVNKFKNSISYLNINLRLILVFENEQSEISDAIKAGITRENIINVNKHTLV